MIGIVIIHSQMFLLALHRLFSIDLIGASKMVTRLTSKLVVLCRIWDTKNWCGCKNWSSICNLAAAALIARLPVKCKTGSGLVSLDRLVTLDRLVSFQIGEDFQITAIFILPNSPISMATNAILIVASDTQTVLVEVTFKAY